MLISIIVPIYNLENRHLDRCIQSILKQTYRDFELILIDDGSTDKSQYICQKFSSIDKRIKIVNKKNGGVSSARNIGIDLCTGEYIAFIDGDDYIDNDYLEHFIKLLPADLIIQSCKDFCYDFDKAKTQYHFQCKIYYNDFSELFSKYNIYNWGAPWARLFKSEIIKNNNIKFDSALQYREDELFFLKYLRYCNTVKTDSYYGYHYMYYPNSSTNKYYGFDHDYKVATSIYLEHSCLGKEQKYNDVFFKIIINKCITSLFYALSNSYKKNQICTKQERVNRIRVVKDFLHKNTLDKNPILKGKYKILLLPTYFIDKIFYLKSIIS